MSDIYIHFSDKIQLLLSEICCECSDFGWSRTCLVKPYPLRLPTQQSLARQENTIHDTASKRPCYPTRVLCLRNKGVFAVLLGSGLSRSTEIPTGWEITLDLVRCVATAQGAEEQPDWAKWYREQTDQEPIYSSLLNEIGSSTPQCHGAQQRVDLSECVLLPLLRRAITQRLGVCDETPHTGRTMPLQGIELVGDVLEATFAAGMS